MPLTVTVVGEKYPIVVTASPSTYQSFPVGTIAYWQSGVFGTPIGLLSSLTLTPKTTKVIQTQLNGLRQVNL